VQTILQFFSHFAWALYVVGLAVAVFEAAVEYQAGRSGAIRDMAMGAIKGLLAVNLFTTVPVELYKLCVGLQSNMTGDITGIHTINGASMASMLSTGALGALGALVGLFLAILVGYATIKVFFSNLKRGGILLIQIAVGSLYMFSVPRGYLDGFYSWCRQVAGLCFTAFMQTTILIAGFMVWNQNILLGCGLMLCAGEVPRIAQAFGLDTSTRANIMTAVHVTQSMVNLTRSFVAAVR